MTNYAFYYILKALFVLKIFKFLYYVEKRPDKKAKVISNIMTSQSVTQTVTINILSDISKSKGNQTMKFGQLIE